MAGTWWRTDAVPWQAEGWSVEIRDDELAEIRHRGRMLLRGVRAVVRDHGWNTVPAVVESMTASPTGVEFRLRHEGLGAHLASRLLLDVAGTDLTVRWDADNLVAFDTCRAGLVVLHPASDAGSPVAVTHSDGSLEQSAFPARISPHQPIMDIRELRVGTPGSQFSIRFEGDVFETEDQRNWTDASFKTYSRPLALPYPYRLDAGETIHQTVVVQAPTESATDAPAKSAAVIEVRPAGVFPEIGVEASTVAGPVPADGAGTFRVVELDLRTTSWPAALERAAADGRPLDVRVVAHDHEVSDAVGHALARLTASGTEVLRVTAYDADLHVSDAAVVSALRAALESAGLPRPVLGGSRSHFTELNREQSRLPEGLDGLVVNTAPLFHSLDTEQLVEAIAMQRLVAEQSVDIGAGVAVHIGPVSLRPRFNNVATAPQLLPSRADLSEGYGAEFTGASDDRQQAPELAAWLIASAAALAIPGVVALSWFETWGPRGLRDAHGPKPAAVALEALGALSGGTLLTGESPDGLVWAVGARSVAGDTLLLANLDRRERQIKVQAQGGRDEQTVLDAGAWKRIRLDR